MSSEVTNGGAEVVLQPQVALKTGVVPRPGLVPRPGAVAQPEVADRADVSERAAELLRLLADSNRRRIFLRLMRGEYCNCELSAELGLPENLVSHHVRKLRAAGLVEEHRDPTDARWVHIRVDLNALGAVWGSLSSAFDPARAGSRLPGCGRLAR